MCSARSKSSVVETAACVFLDCDGVIFDVNAAKTAAFRRALTDYPEPLVEALVDYHVRHGGISRYEKFRWFFQELHPSSNVEAEVARASERFAAIVRDAYGRSAPRLAC